MILIDNQNIQSTERVDDLSFEYADQIVDNRYGTTVATIDFMPYGEKLISEDNDQYSSN